MRDLPDYLKDGDLLKIDTACKLNGWCADAAVTQTADRLMGHAPVEPAAP